MKSIMERRSIRSFQERPIEKEKIENILRAGMQAPSAKDCRCWEFLIVTKEEDKKNISKMSEYGMCAAEAGAVIIPLVNFHLTNPEELWWVEDMSAATQTMLIQIEEEGLGGTWLGMYPLMDRVKKLKEYFNLPDHILPFAMIACGYKAKNKPAEDRWDEKKIYWGSYETETSEKSLE